MSWLSANWGVLLGAAYGLAMLGTHVFPDNTIAYKVSKWLVSGASGPKSVAAFVTNQPLDPVLVPRSSTTAK